MFEKYFAPQWELQTPETVIAPYEDCGIKSVAKSPFDKKFYQLNECDDLELFDQCIAAHKDFCSNVDAVKIAEDGNYEIITAPQSVINRLQAEAQKKTPPQQVSATPQDRANQPFQAQRTQRPKPSTDSKSLLIPIAATVAVILVVLFFLMS